MDARTTSGIVHCCFTVDATHDLESFYGGGREGGRLTLNFLFQSSSHRLWFTAGDYWRELCLCTHQVISTSILIEGGRGGIKN